MMEIKYALLGFLSWKPFTGYELKKLLADSLVFYWSGNNNQIYTTLVEMHKEGLVTNEVQHQDRYPSRKIYSITENGLSELKKWIVTNPELPQLRKAFLIQLAWADQLEAAELDELLEKYEYEIDMQIRMLREQGRRGSIAQPARTPREKYIWEMISDNYLRSYDMELQWVQSLRRGLKGF
jgi:DNA-binding PadR family transcriptional regulator